MKLNAATRLQAQTEVTSAHVPPERIKTYMSSLYTQLLKVLRHNLKEVDKKSVQLTKDAKGQRMIFVKMDHSGPVIQALIKLGWTQSKKGPKPYIFKYRDDGTWPLLWYPLPSKDGFGLTVAPVDHIDEAKKALS